MEAEILQELDAGLLRLVQLGSMPEDERVPIRYDEPGRLRDAVYVVVTGRGVIRHDRRHVLCRGLGAGAAD